MRYCSLISVLLILLSCTSCTHHRNHAPNTSFFQETSNLISQNQALPTETLQTLNTINNQIANNHIGLARALLQSLRNEANSSRSLKVQSALLKAKINLKTNRVAPALKKMHQLETKTSLNTPEQLAILHLKLSALYRSPPSLERAQTEMKINAICLQANCQIPPVTLWDSLTTLSHKTLTQQRDITQNLVEKSWFALAAVAKEHTNNPQALFTALNQWRFLNPKHPGNSLLSLLPQKDFLHNTQNIAVLLPASGPYAPMANAIREGLMNTYFQLPARIQQKTHLSFYDTSTETSIVNLYQKAEDEGATFVIGPLTKPKVEALLGNTFLKTPTLTLNYPPKYMEQSNAYHFGLSPENEGKQMATLALELGYRRALLIQAHGPSKLTPALMNEWTENNGVIIEKIKIQQSKGAASTIANLLKVNESYQRIKAMRRLVGGYLRSIPQRRQDADVIFLVANPKFSQQVFDMLSFYYAKSIPIITSSWSNQDNTLTGHHASEKKLYFTDIPLVIHQNSSQKRVTALQNPYWKKHPNEYLRFYAIGMDAFTLANSLPMMEKLPNFAQQGKTGKLYLLPNHHISSELSRAIIRSGKIHELKA
jgi:outer membrane PBP1 activator LpoA protein